MYSFYSQSKFHLLKAQTAWRQQLADCDDPTTAGGGGNDQFVTLDHLQSFPKSSLLPSSPIIRFAMIWAANMCYPRTRIGYITKPPIPTCAYIYCLNWTRCGGCAALIDLVISTREQNRIGNKRSVILHRWAFPDDILMCTCLPYHKSNVSSLIVWGLRSSRVMGIRDPGRRRHGAAVREKACRIT